MESLPTESLITILLFLIGAPALLIQIADNEVRFTLTHNLLYIMLLFTGLPVLLGALVVVTAIFVPQAARWSNYLLLVLLLLALFVSIFGLPVSRKREVVKRLRGKMVRSVTSKGRIPDEDMKTLVLLGMESRPGDERWWAIHALGHITNAYLSNPKYDGCKLDAVMEGLRKILFGSDRIGSPENFNSVVEVLRPVIQRYYQSSKENPWFSDSDLSNAHRLLSIMGQRAVQFPIENATFACIDALDGLGAANSSASQALSEIGIAAVTQNRIGPAREALHILDAIIATRDLICDDEEIAFDYLALLAAFWNHSGAGNLEAKRYLDDLNNRDKPAEAELADQFEEPGEPRAERLLSRLMRQAVRHHTTVGRFMIATDIQLMWDQYQM